jgi:hypothetical protein
VGWTTVYICDAHWEEQEGKRLPIRIIPDGIYIVTEPCYLCGQHATIPVRRDIDDEACVECADEGIIRVNNVWYCLNHVAKGFDPSGRTARHMRRAWATGLAEACGIPEFNGSDDAA